MPVFLQSDIRPGNATAPSGYSFNFFQGGRQMHSQRLRITLKTVYREHRQDLFFNSLHILHLRPLIITEKGFLSRFRTVIFLCIWTYPAAHAGMLLPDMRIARRYG